MQLSMFNSRLSVGSTGCSSRKSQKRSYKFADVFHLSNLINPPQRTLFFPLQRLVGSNGLEPSTGSLRDFQRKSQKRSHKFAADVFPLAPFIKHHTGASPVCCFMVGSNGLEPSTSRLSGVCSNQLSYEPVFWWR